MESETQKKTNRLIEILREGKYRRDRAPLIIFIILFMISALTYMKFQMREKENQKYFISRGSYFDIKDIQKAKELNIDLAQLGEQRNHILYYIFTELYDLEVLNQLQKSGINFFATNIKSYNALEQVLMYSTLGPSSINIISKNIATLVELKLEIKEATIRELSKKCEQYAMSCVNMAIYFKIIKQEEHTKSYAKRACYQSEKSKYCEVVKDYIKE
ncbi:hypothetical protein [Halobacteriovorax sp. HLS]|uniref:hypothetical protein n=1 Tax=Halobacteriovorax sp. HLS TaxID=2234000 RepID=UPI000FD6DB53|nr:hypothetical protein [Halobacteriovorax sp. HLS]